MSVLKEIGTVSNESCQITFEWIVKNFFSYTQHNSRYFSPKFNILNSEWKIEMRPNRALGSTAYLSLYLHHCDFDGQNSKEVDITFGIKTVSNCIEKKKKTHWKTDGFGFGYSKLIKRSELEEKEEYWVPSGNLTVYFTLNMRNCQKEFHIDAKDADMNTADEIGDVEIDTDKGARSLLKNYRQMFLDGLMTDLVLKVDNREFKVHKMVLVAQSPVFASMFQHDLKEKNENVVDIPDCAAESFEVFLEYLYCASAGHMSPRNVYNVYYAADKYQVEDLKVKCVKFMCNNISVEEFCDIMKMSLLHGELKLQRKAINFFCKNIKEIIKTLQWQIYLRENPTEANELLIKALHA